jgi:ferredoxin-NADP reductase
MGDRRDMVPLIVREIIRETPFVVSVSLEHAEGQPLPPWQPGAHLDVQLLTRHERQYSLCGDPGDTSSYRIAVLNEPLSRGGSHYIHNFLRVGSRVYARPPRNLFALGEAPEYLLLAAGIGITPILSMARHLESIGADWRMIYAVRSQEDAAFTRELASFGDRVSPHVSGEAGRLDLAGLLAGVHPGTAVYACGPSGFTEALLALRSTMPAGSELHTERFEPKPRTHVPNEPFTVVCATSDRVVEVPAHRSMLQSLQAEGVDVQGSCLRGVCGSCALRVVDGVPDHRDSLNADDSSMTIYPCVSRSVGTTLVVDA